MQRTINIQIVVSGNDTGASDFEAKVQTAAHEALHKLCGQPLVTGAHSGLGDGSVEYGVPTAIARVDKVYQDAGGVSDA